MIRRRAEHSSDKNQFNEVTYLLCKAIVVEIDMYDVSYQYCFVPTHVSERNPSSQPVSQSINRPLHYLRYLPHDTFLLEV